MDHDNTSALERLTVDAMRLSNEAANRSCTWSEEQISLAFGRIALTAVSFLRFLPDSSWFSDSKEIAAWDIASAASLTRNAIEAYYVMVYLRIPNLPAEDPSFKQVLWEYHEAFERHEMLKTSLPNSSKLPEVAAKLADAKNALTASPYFALQKEGRRDEFLKAKTFKLLSNVEISVRAGISEKYYRSEYKKCSAFAHSAPFSISQLREFRAGDPRSEALFRSLVRTFTGYLSFAMRDFVLCFPNSPAAAGTTETIHFWEEVLKWERNPHFTNLK